MKHTWVEVDLAVLGENVRNLRAALAPRAELIAVVKADAYGHGAVPVARQALREGARWFAVAHAHEAMRLRAALGTEFHVIILGVVRPEEVPPLLDGHTYPITVSPDHARALGAAARAAGGVLPVHLKLDTGMGRLGMSWNDAPAACREILRAPGIEVIGACTHFARVEETEDDPARVQMERFSAIVRPLEKDMGRTLFKHVSSSRALLAHPDWDLDGVRPGILLYGYGAARPDGRLHTRPILQWKTRVAQVRRAPAGFPVGYYGTYVTPAPTTLGVISLGYADGYLRALSNKGQALIRGRRCRVVGRVSMNWITVDLGPNTDCVEGDEATLLGCDRGECIWADELALLCRTIPYEILTGINAAIERRYDSPG